MIKIKSITKDNIINVFENGTAVNYRFHSLDDIKRLAKFIPFEGLDRALSNLKVKSNVSDVLKEVKQDFLKIYKVSENQIQFESDEYEGSLSLHDWGTWYISDDEDEYEDYDNRELSPKDYKKANEILKNYEKKYPDVEFEFFTSEKNWLDIHAARR